MAEERSPILRATSPMLISGIKSLLDLKFSSARTVEQRERQASAGADRVGTRFGSEASQRSRCNEICPSKNEHLHWLYVLGLRIRAELGATCEPRRASDAVASVVGVAAGRSRGCQN